MRLASTAGGICGADIRHKLKSFFFGRAAEDQRPKDQRPHARLNPRIVSTRYNQILMTRSPLGPVPSKAGRVFSSRTELAPRTRERNAAHSGASSILVVRVRYRSPLALPDTSRGLPSPPPSQISPPWILHLFSQVVQFHERSRAIGWWGGRLTSNSLQVTTTHFKSQATTYYQRRCLLLRTHFESLFITLSYSSASDICMTGVTATAACPRLMPGAISEAEKRGTGQSSFFGRSTREPVLFSSHL